MVLSGSNEHYLSMASCLQSIRLVVNVFSFVHVGGMPGVTHRRLAWGGVTLSQEVGGGANRFVEVPPTAEEQ